MEEDLSIGLAISLNAYNNEARSRIMPINNKYPIETLVSVAEEYFEKTGRPVTFEYVLMEDENDTPEAVKDLAALLSGIVCKLNVIPVNPSRYGDVSPSDDKVRWFAQCLYDLGITATIRKSRGKDIKGACGQLTASRMQ
jgi:23S rRNA (adenine2503-C2)-methyltransferase